MSQLNPGVYEGAIEAVWFGQAANEKKTDFVNFNVKLDKRVPVEGAPEPLPQPVFCTPGVYLTEASFKKAQAAERLAACGIVGDLNDTSKCVGTRVKIMKGKQGDYDYQIFVPGGGFKPKENDEEVQRRANALFKNYLKPATASEQTESTEAPPQTQAMEFVPDSSGEDIPF